MPYFVPPQTAFHQEKNKALSFLWFLSRHPAGDRRQLAICRRMAASWIHISTGEPFVFWKLQSALSGYRQLASPTRWSNRLPPVIAANIKSAYQNAKYLDLWAWFWPKKSAFFPPVLLPLFPACCDRHTEEKAFTSSFNQSQCMENHSSIATGYFLLPFSAGLLLSAVEVPTGAMP